MSYYFTFGSSGQIYEGGWIEIKANTIKEAQQKFIDYYGEKAWKYEGILNYASDYNQEQYESMEMFRTGNLGEFCREVLY